MFPPRRCCLRRPPGTAFPTGAPAGTYADHLSHDLRRQRQMKSSRSPTMQPDAALAIRQRRLLGAAAAGSALMGGRAPQPRTTTPASTATRICQRRCCARPARHRDEHASQRTCVKARAPAASSHVAAASAPPCPSATSGHKTHMAVATGQERQNATTHGTGSERPQTDIGPKSRRHSWHAPPHLKCFASGADSNSRASPPPRALPRSRRCSPTDPGAREAYAANERRSRPVSPTAWSTRTR